MQLLASLLACYPEISMIDYDAQGGTIDFIISLSIVPSREEYDKFRELVDESILTYHSLAGIIGGMVDVSLEGHEHTSFLHLKRDADTVSQGEIRMLAGLTVDYFGDALLVEHLPELPEGTELPYDSIDRLMGSLKKSSTPKHIIGISDGGRVMIYSK